MARSRSNKRRYSWRDGVQGVRVKQAAALGIAIEEVSDAKGRYSISDLVRYAKAKRSPIHSLLEWNDKVAAGKWRHKQMQYYVAHLQVELIEDGGDGRVMPVSVSLQDESGRWVSNHQQTDKVLSSSETRQMLVDQALKMAVAWRERYDYLHELADIFAAIDAAKTKAKR